jgi:DNA topoisomerase-1
MLNYVDDQAPGITRKKLRLGWGYYGPDGKRISDRAEIERLTRSACHPLMSAAGSAPTHKGICRRSASIPRAASNIAIIPISGRRRSAQI